VPKGNYTLEDPIVEIESSQAIANLHLTHSWPVRIPRPTREKVPSDNPLITGQRIIDFFFPIAKGGTAAIPGDFGTGKTITQHQLAKWADADVIVYVGCGERGNEMTEVLETFPELKDPRSGHPLMERTLLVANTSNMPIAAREASMYTGITLAEYFRDMGYDVALMADSTSRWAEALREVSGRLEEMPGEEGYPAYLASRLAQIYERAGRVKVIGTDEDKLGSISIIGAVSPSGGDFSEPVTQNTLRIVKVFWALSKALAERRHFPAIDWLTSYSLYLDSLENWYRAHIHPEWSILRKEAMALLQRDEELREIVMLVGPDALSESQRVVLEAARMIKEDFLIQSALHAVDSYCSPEKTFRMMSLIMNFYDKMKTGVEKGVSLQRALEMPVKQEIARAKIHPSETFEVFAKDIQTKTNQQFQGLIDKMAEVAL
jgi:V/A-type H+-transporting ATPase subunit A